MNLPEGEPFLKKGQKSWPRMLGTLTCFAKTDGQQVMCHLSSKKTRAGTIQFQVQISQVKKLIKACNTITYIYHKLPLSETDLAFFHMPFFF